MALTPYFLNMIVDNISTKESTFPTSHFYGISQTEPTFNTDTGAWENITEPTAPEYERVEFTADDWSVAGEDVMDDTGTNVLYTGAVGVTRNKYRKEYPESDIDWSEGVPYTHFVVFDGQVDNTGANLLSFGTLDNPRTVEIATLLAFKIGGVSFSAQNQTVSL